MTQIQIWKAGKQYAYMPSENNFSSTGRVDGVTITGPSPVGTTETKVYDITHIINNTYCSGKIYLPEADLNWGDVYDANHTDRLAVIVGVNITVRKQKHFTAWISKMMFRVKKWTYCVTMFIGLP